MSSAEERFIAAVRSPEGAAAGGRDGGDGSELATLMTRMRTWLAALDASLDAARIPSAGLQADSALAQRISALHAELAAQRQQRARQWQALAPARALAQQFEGKLMLLVFGKFNAGKSSLCNFLATRFARQGQAVQTFYLRGGDIVTSSQPFHEGATETTARLQGVCLGDGLVLLDTPGLHSATDDNAALTQRFLDSADGVLWLTSSTSPGQVQELDELARELRRGKPLLPVLTRSDVIEEDELDGEIVKRLRNKSAANRADQEADVRSRAAAKLAALGVAQSQLKPPVSVSAHVAGSAGDDRQAMREAGFERLYAALLDLLTPALGYRQRKPGEVLLHHLQEQVLAPLQAHTLPALTALHHVLEQERAALPARQSRLVQAIWRTLIPDLPALLEQHAPTRDVATVCATLAQRLTAALTQQAPLLLAPYLLPGLPAVVLATPSIGYESAADGLPLSYDKLYAALDQAVLAALDEQAAALVRVCLIQVDSVQQAVQRKQELIEQGQRALLEIEGALRSPLALDHPVA